MQRGNKISITIFILRELNYFKFISFIIYIIKLISRQLSQVQDHNMLKLIIPDSSRSQDRDIKKLLVNAQITAMLSALEGLGLVIIVLISIISGSYAIAIFLFRLLENIVLPYLYLINTQEKRDQILRGGWMEFLRSFFRSHEISSPFNRSNLVESFNHEEQSSKTEISTISHKCNSNDKQETKEENLCLNTLNCNLNAPFEETPSTSDNGRLKRVNNFSSESKNISKDENVKLVTSSLLVRKERAKILDDLIRAVGEEMKYLQLFAHFNYLENSRYEESYLYTSEMIDREIILQKIIKIAAKNSSLSRSEIRKEKLKKLKICLNDENTYQTHLNQLIDIEEDFMNDRIT